ncbi:phenazine biosynthesis-like protein domain containing 1 [Cricetulus griseus]
MEEVKQAPSKAETLQTEPVRKMKLPIFIADAFTTTAFRGNPAAVCLLENAAIGDTLVQDIQYSPDTRKLLVRLSDSYSRSFLETLKVNTKPLPGIEKTGKVKGLILTLRGQPEGQTPQYDFYSRYFAPWVGLPEDPVTGSAHTVLSSYWSQQLGKKEMRAFQCSRRGGELDISLRPDGRVDMKGGAAIVLEGTLTV